MEMQGFMGLFDWLQAVFALIATLALIGVGAYAARRFGLMGAGARAGAERRLRVVESLMLDARRRVVILACDGREHIILLSPEGDVRIDTTAKAEAAP